MRGDGRSGGRRACRRRNARKGAGLSGRQAQHLSEALVDLLQTVTDRLERHTESLLELALELFIHRRPYLLQLRRVVVLNEAPRFRQFARVIRQTRAR